MNIQFILGVLLGVGIATLLSTLIRKGHTPIWSSLACGTAALAYFGVVHGWYLTGTGVEFTHILLTPVLGAVAGLVGLLCSYAIVFMLGGKTILIVVVPVLCGMAGWSKGGVFGVVLGVVAALVLLAVFRVLADQVETGTRRSQVVVIVLASFLTSALIDNFFRETATDKITYATVGDRQKLPGLAGKSIAVFPTQYNQRAFPQQDIEATVVEDLLARYETAFAAEASSIYRVSKVTGPNRYPADFGEMTSREREAVQDYLTRIGADGAFLTRCAFGYTDANATQFWFACYTLLVDQKGVPIWQFYGKAWSLQAASQKLSPVELTRAAVGLEGTPVDFGANMEAMCDNYAPFVVWLLTRDLAGESRKNYFTDYVTAKKNPNILVYPASHGSEPFVSDAQRR